MRMPNAKSGQSLYEVVFATAIAALILVGVVSLVTTSLRNSTLSKNNAQATKFTQEAVEWLREERDTDWSYFFARAPVSSKCLGSLNWSSGCPIPQTVFDRRVTLSVLNADTIEALVWVTWNDGQGVHETRSVTRFTKWR